MLDLTGVPESLKVVLRDEARLRPGERDMAGLVEDMSAWLMSSRSISTCKKCASYFKRYESFMKLHHRKHLPARSIDIALFVTHLLNCKVSHSVLISFIFN